MSSPPPQNNTKIFLRVKTHKSFGSICLVDTSKDFQHCLKAVSSKVKFPVQYLQFISGDDTWNIPDMDELLVGLQQFETNIVFAVPFKNNTTNEEEQEEEQQPMATATSSTSNESPPTTPTPTPTPASQPPHQVSVATSTSNSSQQTTASGLMTPTNTKSSSKGAAAATATATAVTPEGGSSATSVTSETETTVEIGHRNEELSLPSSSSSSRRKKKVPSSSTNTATRRSSRRNKKSNEDFVTEDTSMEDEGIQAHCDDDDDSGTTGEKQNSLVAAVGGEASSNEDHASSSSSSLYPIGTWVRKLWMGDGWFDGVISSYDEIEKLYRVTYVKDGDIEDYDSNEIHDLVHRYTQKDVVLDDLTSQEMKELEGIPLDLAHFEDYLYYEDGSTHSNISQIYSRAKLLRNGTGIAYKNWKEGVVFAKDVPITDLSTDFKKLREDAKQYALDHGEDKSHGKALTIPLNKLNDYQKYFYFKIFVPTLSEKRRNELAGIPFELSKFQEFLCCKEAGLNSDQNTIQEIVAKVEMLQKGRGIPLSAGNKGVVFRPKPIVDLSEDFHSLLQEAKEYETLHVGRKADTLSSHFSVGLTILIQKLIDHQKNFYFKKRTSKEAFTTTTSTPTDGAAAGKPPAAAVSAAANTSSSDKKRKGALDHDMDTAEEKEAMETSDDGDDAINNGERKSKRKARRKMMKQLKSPPYEEPRPRSKSSSGKRKARDQGKPQGEEASETPGANSKKRQRDDVNRMNIVGDVVNDGEAKKQASVESGNGERKSEPGAGRKTNEKLYSELSNVQRSLLKGVEFEVAKFKKFLAEEEKFSVTTQLIYSRIAKRLVLGAGVEHDKWPTTFHPTPVDFGDDFVKLYKNANSFHKLHGHAINLRSTIRKLEDYQKFYFHKILGKNIASAAMRDQQAGSHAENAVASLQDTTGAVSATCVVDKDQTTDSSESKEDKLPDKQGRPIGDEHLEATETLGQLPARLDDKEQNTVSNDEPMENARTPRKDQMVEEDQMNASQAQLMDNCTKHGLSDDDGIGQDESSASTAGRMGAVVPMEVGNENQSNGSFGDEKDGASLEAGVSTFPPDIVASLEQPMVSIADGTDLLECNTRFVQQLVVGALVSLKGLTMCADLNGRHGKVTRGLSSEGTVVVKLFHENRVVTVKPENLIGTTDESTKRNVKKNWETEPTTEKQNGAPTPDEVNS